MKPQLLECHLSAASESPWVSCRGGVPPLWPHITATTTQYQREIKLNQMFSLEKPLALILKFLSLPPFLTHIRFSTSGP